MMTRKVPGGPPTRAQLRVKVLAGVVAVTLAALAVFDLVAVHTMRDYLYEQTRTQLVTEAAQAQQELSTLTRATGTGDSKRGLKNLAEGIAGQFDVVWLPKAGQPTMFEIALTTTSQGQRGASFPAVTSTIARVVTKEGFYAVLVAGQMTLLFGSSVSSRGLIVAGTPLAQVTNTLVQTERIVAIGSAAVILIIGAGVFLVLRRGLRPIEAMAAQADRITAGDLADRVTPHDPRSEVGRLGSALNGMLTRIEAAVQQREAGQEQMRQFFADASHELRTPIASLLANAELHQHGALTEPAQITEVMRRMALETQRMGCLVDDMLRLARLGQQPARDREPVDLTALVADCAERARITDPGRGWQVDVAGGLKITGDEELLRRAVDNLCANVLMHTPRDTVGTIAATAADGQVRIEISDDGPGVAADRLPHIFERFYRAGAGGSRPGSGLGLAIVTETAAAHGGTAQAAPASPHGLRITLTLPADQPVPAGLPA
jgi:two-component system OmpR family sensor kinase